MWPLISVIRQHGECSTKCGGEGHKRPWVVSRLGWGGGSAAARWSDTWPLSNASKGASEGEKMPRRGKLVLCW